MQNSQSEVIFSKIPAKYGAIGVITLNRPQALNALSKNMIEAINTHLQAWAVDPTILLVVIKATGERAFCAGGDLKFLYHNRGTAVADAVPFFRTEYNLNLIIHQYPKPYVALLDGITMGGGVGLSIHGQRRIASEYLQLAMPETALGLYPDIGAAYFLSRCPQQLGMYLALTGNTIGIADALLCKLVDAFVPRASLPAIIPDLSSQDLRVRPLEITDAIISKYQTTPTAAPLMEHLDVIQTCFAKDSVEAIIKSLQQHDSAWAKQQAAILATRSPTSLKVTFKNLILGTNRTIQECLEQDLNLTAHLAQQHDIFEGIRAKLIDKTNDPLWHPATLAAVSDAFIDKIFQIQWPL